MAGVATTLPVTAYCELPAVRARIAEYHAATSSRPACI